MSVNMTIQDLVGQAYDLSAYLIDFGRILSGETKKLKVVLKNVGFSTENIQLECVAHPVEQVGLPQDTYEAATLSLTEGGTYYDVLVVGTKGPSVETDIWIKWAMPSDVIPGHGKFALKATGKVIWT